jgi:hypothetical protein
VPDARGRPAVNDRTIRQPLGSLLQPVEHRLGIAWVNLSDFDQHDRMPGQELVEQGPSDAVVVSDIPEEPFERKLPDDSRPLGAVRVGADHHAVGIGECALALSVGVARERTGALPAHAPHAREGPDGGIWARRSGERPHGFPADVVQTAAGQQSDVGSR